jgi:hypothetical protein
LPGELFDTSSSKQRYELRLLTLVTGLFFAGSTLAGETIRLPTEKYPLGALILYESEGGSFHLRRVSINDGKRFGLEILRTDYRSPVKYTLIFDNLGRTTEKRYASGRRVLFEPHNCTRVVGDCSYEMTSVNGDTYKRKISSELLDGVLHAKQMNESGFVLKSSKHSYGIHGALEFWEEKDETKPDEGKSVYKLLAVIPPKDGS